jgi:hypothetical protein
MFPSIVLLCLIQNFSVSEQLFYLFTNAMGIFSAVLRKILPKLLLSNENSMYFNGGERIEILNHLVHVT